MARTHISPEDRQAIYDTLARYVWCMDTGNIDGVVATFAENGVIKDITGKLWDVQAGGVKAFASHFLTQPDRPVSQHWIQHMFVEEATESGYCVTSYWAMLALDAQTNDKSIRSFGRYRDTCVTVNGAWLIQEKVIDPWNRTTLLQLKSSCRLQH